ncbi:MAG: SGNH/GDSL hydrolase family protein [Candidatus Saccharimonadales bacterium]
MGFGGNLLGLPQNNLGDSGDVALNNPANNEVLAYDSTTGKWKNAAASNDSGGSTSVMYGPANPAAGVITGLVRGKRSVVMHVVGDSTTVGVNAWPAALARKIGADFPAYSVWHRSFSPTRDDWNAPTVLQTGTANGGAERGVRPNGGVFGFIGTSPLGADLDVRIKVAPDSWASGSTQTLVAQYNTGNNHRTFSFHLTGTGALAFISSADGVNALPTITSTANPSFSAGSAGWCRVTLDGDNGSDQRVITFYTSSDGNNWNQLGNVFTVSGATTLFHSDEPITAGTRYLVSSYTDRVVGVIHWVEVRSTIGGGSIVPVMLDTWDYLSPNEALPVWVGAPVILFVNGGIGGKDISHFSDPVRAKTLHMDHGSDLFFLNDGHNEDAAATYDWVRRFSNYVNTVVKPALPAVPLVLLGQNAVDPAVYSENALVKRASRGQRLATWCLSQPGVYFVDMFPAITDPATQLSDGLHPTTTAEVTDGTAGQQLMANLVYNQLFAGV